MNGEAFALSISLFFLLEDVGGTVSFKKFDWNTY